MTVESDLPVAINGPGAVAATSAPAQEEDETSAADLVLPLVAVGAAGALAGYGYVRRTRRARTRTTPAGTPTAPSAPPLTALDKQARALLTEADDCVRTSREELGFAEARFGTEAVAPFASALRDAESELSAAFRMRQRYDDGVPADETSRRHVLAGIVGRCQEAGRRLDAQAPAFDQLRALERELGAALAVAETRFRELAGRTPTTQATLTDLAELYAPSAAAPVTGYVEQAKDRLVFAGARLNQARQSADMDSPERAARHLRAAEGAVDQAAVFLSAVHRLADELRAATKLVPAALTGAEAELAGVRGVLPAAGEWEQPADAGMGAMAGAVPDAGRGPATGEVEAADDAGRPVPPGAPPDVPVGELRSRVLHADAVLTSVRQELTGGQPYDPLDVLHRIVRALAPVATGRAGVLPAAARLTAHSATAAADDFVTTHRGAVGADARTRLAAAAQDLLHATTLTDLASVRALARQAHELAEQDVRTHGNPLAGAADASRAGGAVLGGILLDGGSGDSPPACFGGPLTRARRNLPPG
ncbi:hypothetical protein AB0I77_09780 [Streptomyces sp. NPDC050619]|uniref:hypothetical protein n=1 Tax=Streptomyces sp. NPDC050619 TaxID=3157214 RepID=UPI00342B5844